MNKFLTSFFGAFVGTWIAFLLFGLVIFICGIIMMSSLSFSAIQSSSTKIADNSILYVDLSGPVYERPYNRSLQEYINEQQQPGNLQDMLKAIESAASDDRIAGIYLHCNSINTGVASIKAIRDALQDFKNNSGKWVYAYGDAISQADYYITSVADSIFLNPVGQLDLHGLISTTVFYKGLLDKLGIEMQIMRVGTFKSAVEPFMLTSMSEASKLQTQTYINNLWKNICDSIAASRSISIETINEFADSMGTLKDPKLAVSDGFIDGVCYSHEFESKLKELTGIKENKDLNLVGLEQYVHSLPKEKTSKNQVAVLYASGDINISGNQNGINSEELVPIILDLAKNEEIKGLVLRVNSPGGSAYASEQIWEALEQFKQTGKPFAVSMGDYAASGGYYISCGADHIFAEPTTITGSIGIFGMIASFETLMSDKLGLNVEFTTTNKNSDLSIFKPMSPIQRAAMQNYINRGYELFTQRCSDGRNMPLDKLKSIAEGRVWDATEALKNGLIDDFGNLTDAVQWVANEAEISDYSVQSYPENKEDFVSIVFSTLSDAAYEKVLTERYGNVYLYFEEIRKILNQDNLQCRMENIRIE